MEAKMIDRIHFLADSQKKQHNRVENSLKAVSTQFEQVFIAESLIAAGFADAVSMGALRKSENPFSTFLIHEYSRAISSKNTTDIQNSVLNTINNMDGRI
jgi:hypothetical protein